MYGGFHKWGSPKAGWFISWTFPTNMDDQWYTHFRKPPYRLVYMVVGISKNITSIQYPSRYTNRNDIIHVSMFKP